MTSKKDLMRCRLCGCEALERAFHLGNMPRWNHRLLGSHEVASDRGVDLTMFACGQCGFVMLPTAPADEYYEDYVNAPSFSPQMRAAQLEQATAFVRRFGLEGKRVLEVGCGDGSYLECLALAGAVARGIEPSAAQRAIALTRGLTVDAGVLPADRGIADAPFDAFVTRQVLEHVGDIASFVLGVRRQMKAGAVGLVEVPNFDKLRLEGRYFDFIPEHVNYFTPTTLRLALELHGFEVLETAPAIEGEALCALVSLPPAPDFGAAERGVAELSAAVSAFVADSKRLGGEVAVWGAGGKGLSILACADLRGVDHVLDSDPHKLGRFTPVSHLVVSHPDILRERDVQAIVITAPAYQREIRQVLEERYHFRGRIALVDGGLRVIQERMSAGVRA